MIDGTTSALVIATLFGSEIGTANGLKCTDLRGTGIESDGKVKALSWTRGLFRAGTGVSTSNTCNLCGALRGGFDEALVFEEEIDASGNFGIISSEKESRLRGGFLLLPDSFVGGTANHTL